MKNKFNYKYLPYLNTNSDEWNKSIVVKKGSAVGKSIGSLDNIIIYKPLIKGTLTTLVVVTQ